MARQAGGPLSLRRRRLRRTNATAAVSLANSWRTVRPAAPILFDDTVLATPILHGEPPDAAARRPAVRSF